MVSSKNRNYHRNHGCNLVKIALPSVGMTGEPNHGQPVSLTGIWAFELLRSLPDRPLIPFAHQDRVLSPQRDKDVSLNSVAALPSSDAHHSCSSPIVFGRRPLTPSKSSASLSPLPSTN